jgi:phage/plasmid-like protein (TIGR03299 family)
MAHLLRRDDNMAYVGAKPWHGLGVEVSGDLTPEQMMDAAGLNWKVCQMPLLVQGKRENRAVPSHVANVRSTDGKILDIVSKDYKPTQNAELFKFFKAYTDAGEMQMHTAGSLDGGRIIWALAKLNAEFTLPGRNDKTEMHLLLSSGHKVGFALQVDLTAIRVVCFNTLSMARGRKGKGGDGEQYGRYRMIHTATFDKTRQSQAREVVRMGRESLDRYRHVAERLVNVRFDREATRAYVIELLQPKLFSEVIEQTQSRFSNLRPVTPGKVDGARVLAEMLSRDQYRFNADDFSPTTRTVLESIERRQPGARETAGTAWGAFNGVTYWVDHLRGESRDTGLQAAWYGPGAQLKNDALDLAVEYANRLETLKAA